METRGRKPLPPGQKRSVQMGVKMTPLERERAKNNARLAGYELATLVRLVVVEGDLSAIDALIRVTNG